MSIYRYFNSKTGLLIASVNTLWEEIISELIGSSTQADYYSKSGYAQIQNLMQGFQHLFDEHSKYIVFSYDYKLYLIRQSAYLSEEIYRDELKPVRDLFVNALNKGMDDGSIAIRVNADDVYYAIWGLMRGYIAKVSIYDSMYAGKNLWREHFNLACSLILNGLKYETSEI